MRGTLYSLPNGENVRVEAFGVRQQHRILQRVVEITAQIQDKRKILRNANLIPQSSVVSHVLVL